MPLDQDQRNDILAHIRDISEADGVSLSADNFVQILFDNWDDVINPAKMDRKALRRNLQDLREQKRANKAANTSIDEQIREITTQLE